MQKKKTNRGVGHDASPVRLGKTSKRVETTRDPFLFSVFLAGEGEAVASCAAPVGTKRTVHYPSKLFATCFRDESTKGKV